MFPGRLDRTAQRCHRRLRLHLSKISSLSLTKKHFLWAIYCSVPVVLLRFYFLLHASSSVPSVPAIDSGPHFNPLKEKHDSHNDEIRHSEIQRKSLAIHEGYVKTSTFKDGQRCDLSNGQWVHDPSSTPPYTEHTCKAVSQDQACLAHGRPDRTYLQWRWQPSDCTLPRFDPNTFLDLNAGRKLVFVGDSMARNQLESLLCLLGQVSAPTLTYMDRLSKFRTWELSSHNLTLSILWSPFLVNGTEKNGEIGHNNLELDVVDGRWSEELKDADMVVVSVGHWFVHSAIYYEKNHIIGCHYCGDMNHKEIGFFGPFRKVLRTSFKSILKAKRRLNVVVTSFTPAHFDFKWDKPGACERREPYKEGEKELNYMERELRKIQIEEVEAFNKKGRRKGVRFEVLDVTQLAFMRPDAHPGPYLVPFPFAEGKPEETVRNDCVHWCLPGAIDAWNEILLEMMKSWSQVDQFI